MSNTMFGNEADIEQLMRRVYVGLRHDRLDPQDVVALACEFLDWLPCTDAIARVSIPALTSLPSGWRRCAPRCVSWPAALAPPPTPRGDRDLPTRGIEGEPEIEILEDCFPAGAGVRLADGQRLNWGGPILPNMCDDPTIALTSLAILIQESLLERTWQVWPVCPRHDLGVHSVRRESEVEWWCAGDGGHTLAPVGELAGQQSLRTPRRLHPC
ncbi:hypothetical protein [Streptomyces sp. NPDC007074]|uniref:hypothetical protein n=1 Tax=Streptomyces sp. NPDC007074 TaxID=3156764 RepID=UPI00340A985B